MSYEIFQILLFKLCRVNNVFAGYAVNWLENVSHDCHDTIVSFP